MKFEQALPAMRVGYVIGVHYPVNGVTTWYSKCPIHPHDVYVHGFSRVKDMIGQFPSSDAMRDDWIVGQKWQEVTRRSRRSWHRSNRL